MRATVLVVARREFRARLWSRRVLASSVLVLVLLVVFLLLQAFVFGAVKPIRVGLAGQAIALADGLPQETASLGVTVAVSQVDSVAEGVAAVRAGRLDVLVSGARAALHVTVDNQLDPQLRTTLNGLVRQQVLDAQIAQLGVRPQDVLSRVDQAQISLTQLNVTDPNRPQAIAVGVLTGLLVTLSLALFAGLAVRQVAEDRSRGTAEVLLTVLRPRRLLAGGLVGLGAAGFVHLAAIGAIGALIALIAGVVSVPGSVLVAVVGGLLWYVLGFALFGTACAGLAGRATEHRRLLAWLGGGLCVLFTVGTVLVANDPAGAAEATLSVLPPFAPVLMPARMAVGVAPGWQVLLAIALSLLVLAGLAGLVGRGYGRSVLGR
ncbi:MAG TPA: ABC transporter permease [Pseudonocardiaceae bacterium]|nr:ABC transporter permease [Pseudonocardiaceae bacterium]